MSRSHRVLPLDEADAATVMALHGELIGCPTSGEAAAAVTLRLMLHSGNRFARHWGVPRISRYRLEAGIPGGRIDAVLFHVDGSVSLVEVKSGQSDRRSILGGIGQLCYYASHARRAFRLGADTTVRRILCGPFDPEDMMEITDACNMAGVMLRNLPPYLTIRTELIAYRAEIAQLTAEHP